VQVSTFVFVKSCTGRGGTPQFRYLANSTTLRLQPTREADAVAVANKRKSFPPCKSPEDVERAARQAAGGFLVSEDVVLAHSELQFGQYRGQSFLWVLEKAAGYAVGLVDSVDGEPSLSKVTLLGVNKTKFCQYTLHFREVRDALEMRRLTDSLLQETRANTWSALGSMHVSPGRRSSRPATRSDGPLSISWSTRRASPTARRCGVSRSTASVVDRRHSSSKLTAAKRQSPTLTSWQQWKTWRQTRTCWQ